MASMIIIMVDIQELGMNTPEPSMMFCLDDPSRIDRYIRELSARWPNNTICVYTLSSMQKIKEPPKYARYTVNHTTGEITPA